MVKLPPNVISHWCQLFESFQASPLTFYQAVAAAIETRKVPELQQSRTEFKEGGSLTAHREYFRIVRGRYAFDICAAPFGTGFFFSWWLTEIKSWVGWLYLLGFLFVGEVAAKIIYTLIPSSDIININGLVYTPLVLAALFWCFGYAVREGFINMQQIVLMTPFVGWVYEHVFNPPTFYNLDSAMMFQQAVHNAVMEVIDGMTKTNGLRALSEGERKPILRAFAKSA